MAHDGTPFGRNNPRGATRNSLACLRHHFPGCSILAQDALRKHRVSRLDQLDAFFDSSAFMVVPPSALNADHARSPFDPPDMDSDPVRLISGQLLRPVLEDSLAAGMDSTSASRRARSLVWSSQVHPRAQGIWDTMTAEELLTFRFNAGGEATQRIAWSRASRRFFTVWACC